MSFGKVPIFASYCRRGADSGNYRPIKPPPTSGAAPVRSTSSSGLATPTSTTYQTSHPPLFPASDARYPEHGRNRGKQTENSSDGRLNPASSPDLSFVRLKTSFLLCFPVNRRYSFPLCILSVLHLLVQIFSLLRFTSVYSEFAIASVATSESKFQRVSFDIALFDLVRHGSSFALASPTRRDYIIHLSNVDKIERPVRRVESSRSCASNVTSSIRLSSFEHSEDQRRRISQRACNCTEEI